MLAERLRLTDDPLLRRDKGGVAYTERPCEYCGEPAWMRVDQRFCSISCGQMTSRAGKNHPLWKGDTAGYTARHLRVKKARGKADHCSLRPGLSDCISEDYEWAQIHGTDGLDVREYVSLCVPCHSAYDHAGVPQPSHQGSNHPCAKLTEAIVLECRDRNAAGETHASLAREFGVAPRTMHNAITGGSWRYVNWPAG